MFPGCLCVISSCMYTNTFSQKPSSSYVAVCTMIVDKNFYPFIYLCCTWEHARFPERYHYNVVTYPIIPAMTFQYQVKLFAAALPVLKMKIDQNQGWERGELTEPIRTVVVNTLGWGIMTIKCCPTQLHIKTFLMFWYGGNVSHKTIPTANWFSKRNTMKVEKSQEKKQSKSNFNISLAVLGLMHLPFL